MNSNSPDFRGAIMCVCVCVGVQDGSSCLHIACRRRDIEIIRYLCDQGGEELLMQTEGVSGSLIMLTSGPIYISLITSSSKAYVQVFRWFTCVCRMDSPASR